MGICGSSKKDQAITPQKIDFSYRKSQTREKEVINTRETQQTRQDHQNETTFEILPESTPVAPEEAPDLRKRGTSLYRRRNNNHHKTVVMNQKFQGRLRLSSINDKNDKDSQKNVLGLDSDHSSVNKSRRSSINHPAFEAQKFQRRNKKSTTLIEKCRLGSKLFQEELRLCVTSQALIDEIKGDPLKKYHIISKLGDGSYGTVFLAVNNSTGLKVAIKKIVKDKDNEVDDLEIKNEIDILKKLDHPNIVKIFEFCEAKDSYYIITEYCKHGELYGYIRDRYNENQLAVLFYQVFSGLCYLHENNILHRDLKLENIMISETEKGKDGLKFFWIKIIDFGTAKIFQRTKSEKAVVGSSYYIAPEVLNQKYNEKCDTWSVGVILYMLIVGRAPFDGKNDDEIIKKIKKGVYDTNHPRLRQSSPELKDLVYSLLEVDTERRISAADALNHPFFKAHGARSLYTNLDKAEVLEYIDNLFNYKFQSKFQQLVLAFIVHNIPQSSDKKTILKLFRFFNVKGDCKLTKTELIKGLLNFKTKDEIENQIEDIFLLLDGDNNGYIEYEEFLRACMDKKRILTDSNLKYAFGFLDKKKKKKLSVANLVASFATNNNRILEEILHNTIKEVDHDDDGEINFDEFKELMTNVS